MKIILGLELENGAFYREKASGYEGTEIRGSVGFVFWLESRLGLSNPSNRPELRLPLVVRAMRELDDGNKFYSASRKIDPFGCGRKVLSLWDEYVGGLSGKVNRKTLSGRPAELLEIFDLFKSLDGPDGWSDRAQKVLKRLCETKIEVGLNEIILEDELNAFPQVLVAILKCLREGGSIIRPQENSVHKAGNSDLEKSLGSSGWRAKGDGSLLHYVCNNRVQSSELTSRLIESCHKNGEEVLLIDSTDGRENFKALCETGQPHMGFSVSNAAIPSLQVLPAYIEWCKNPKDINLCLNFLNLKVSPIPPGMRGRLINALGNESWLWGETWQDAIENYLAAIPDEDKKHRDAVKKRAELWLKPPELNLPFKVSILKRIIEQTRDWVRSGTRKGSLDSNYMRSVEQQCRHLNDMLEAMAQKDLGEAELSTLVASTTEQENPYSMLREKGAVRRVHSPAQILSATDTIIWSPAGLSTLRKTARSFWTTSELKHLEKCGCKLVDPKLLVREEARHWANAAKKANKRLIISSLKNGEAQDEVHPIWHELMFGIKDDSKLICPVEHIYENEILEKGFILPENLGNAKLTQNTNLSDWQVDKKYLKKREYESPSSLEKLLGCPLAWTFAYKMKMFSKGLWEFEVDSMFLGNFCHEILQKYFTHLGKNLPSQNQVEKEILKLFDLSLETNGSLLKQAKYSSEAESTKRMIVSSAQVLMQMMKDGSWSVLGEEILCEFSDRGQKFRGYADLVFERPGEVFILDLKLGGRANRSQQLAQGRSVQLAHYAMSMIKQGKKVKTGYFIIRSAELLTVHEDLSSGFRPQNGDDEEQTWKSVVAQMKVVKSEFSEGLSRPGYLFEDPYIEPPCGYCDYSRLCGKETV